MIIILNILIFSIFMRWFWHHFATRKKKKLIGIILLFLLASFLLFIFSLYVRHDYMDGVQYLIAGGLSVLAFWICTTVIIVWKNIHNKTTQRMFIDLLQVIPLLLIPFLVWYTLSNISFKIGG